MQPLSLAPYFSSCTAGSPEDSHGLDYPDQPHEGSHPTCSPWQGLHLNSGVQPPFFARLCCKPACSLSCSLWFVAWVSPSSDFWSCICLKTQAIVGARMMLLFLKNSYLFKSGIRRWCRRDRLVQKQFLGEHGYNLDLQLHYGHYGVCEDRLYYQPQVSVSHLDTCKIANALQETTEERDLFQMSDFIIFFGWEKCEIIYLMELKDWSLYIILSI